MLEGMSNMEVRNINRSNIVKILMRKGQLTKAGITQELGLSLVTVNTLLKELLEENIVEQGEVQKSTGGRRPVMYQVVRDYYTAVGISLSEYHMRITKVNWTLDVDAAESIRLHFEDTEEYWEQFRKYVHQFFKANRISEKKLMGIAITLPAEIIGDASVEEIEPLGAFAEVDLDNIRGMFKCPVVFMESTKAAGFSHIGRPGNRNTFVYLHLGRRVGGALVSNGDFFGLSNRTGEFGQMFVGEWDINKNPDMPDEMGRERYNTMQYHCSTYALIGSDYEMTLKEFFERLDQGDEECREVWDVYVGHLAIALHNLRVIFDADMMLGGEISPFLAKRKDVLLELLEKGDIYHEPVDYIHFSRGEEFDSCIGAGFMLLEKRDIIEKAVDAAGE